tara:strand:- start:288 stop:614 length:327 start_codon:yes stop_codon:yes gene_type:complete
MFDHICYFRINSEDVNIEQIELEFIDFGVDEVFKNDDCILLYASFDNFGRIQKELEKRSLQIISSGFDRIPKVTNKLLPKLHEEVLNLIEKIDEDDDVQNIYHTLDFQ